MKTSALKYILPPELIASHPAVPRDSARLMVINRRKGRIADDTFQNIDQYFIRGDVLVFNQSRVFPARIMARTAKGRQVEVLFLNEKPPHQWEVLIGGRAKQGEKLEFTHGLTGVIRKGEEKILEINLSQRQLFTFLDKYGSVPLPPYIKRKATACDKKDYQNVFAQAIGSAASPTAGLHFTTELIDRLKEKGVEVEFVTLHVGLGTFAPIKTDKVEDHPIHTEHYEIDAATIRNIQKAKREGRRIIACGTTTLRVLESMNDASGTEKGETNIFIYPGYKFKLVGGLVTNFHTPESSLLALVWAFGGRGLMRRAYQRAIKQRYRFFSYGDGMLII